MNSVAALSRAQQEGLMALGMPIVLLSRMAAERFFSTVTADNHTGGYLAGRYLTQLGHRFIAHITGPKRHGNFSERARGFLKAIEESRKTVKPVIMHGAQSFKGGYDMVRHLIERHPETTAIFTGNDIMAFGAMRALYELGLRIPKEVSLIGFDNLEFSSLLHPPLTTVHQPKYEMGQAAVELLLKLGKRDGRTPEHRMLGVELIERESCMRR
jgi:LacI family transcriptional regulator